MTEFNRDEAKDCLESALAEGQDPKWMKTEGYDGSTAAFTFEDVADVIDVVAWSDEGYAQCTVMAVVLTNDGRYAYVEGGCDTTGWDCRSGVSTSFASSLAKLIQWGLTDDAREKLAGLPSAVASGRYP